MKLTGALLIALLAGCGAADRMVASATGYASSCIAGVKYYQFTSGVTVAYTPDGRVMACK